MRIIALLLLWLFSATAFAESDETKLFLQLDGGISNFSDSRFDGESVSFEDGWSAGFRVGADWQYASFDFELALHQAQASARSNAKVDPLVMTSSGGVSFKFLRTSWSDWYGGLGYVIDIPFDEYERNSDDYPGYYVETGFIIKLTNIADLVPHYRMYWAPRLGETTGAGLIHAARLGVRFSTLLPRQASRQIDNRDNRVSDRRW